MGITLQDKPAVCGSLLLMCYHTLGGDDLVDYDALSILFQGVALALLPIINLYVNEEEDIGRILQIPSIL